MKLLGADLILLVVGLLLIGGAGWPLAAGGYLQQNASGSAAGTPTSLFDVTFSTADQAAQQQNIASMATGTSVFTVQHTNVTKVRVEVTCSDTATGAQASPFTFSIDITGPNGLKGSVSQRTCGAGVTAVDVPVTPVPAPKKISGADARAAEAASLDGNASKAKGDWTIKATGSRSVGALPIAAPGGTVKVSATTWTAKATPVQTTK